MSENLPTPNSNCDIERLLHLFELDEFKSSSHINSNESENLLGQSDIARLNLHPSASLTVGWPSDSTGFTGRIVWAPFGLPMAKSRAVRNVTFLCSRLGQNLDKFQRVFDALRTRVAHRNSDEAFLTASGMSVDKYVRRAAAWFDAKLVAIDWIPKNAEEDWLQNSCLRCDPNQFPIYVSPTLLLDDDDVGLQNFDRLLSEMADEIAVLHVTTKGNVNSAIQGRLERGHGITCFLDSCDSKILSRHVDQGGVLWHLIDEVQPDCPRQQANSTIPQTNTDQRKPFDFSKYLTHCTRAQKKKWIDETETQAIDRTLFRIGGNDNNRLLPCSHSAMGTLLKIVAQRMVIGGAVSIRGKHACVSFTELPLPQLLNERRFRHHRARWDFEPYGIAILRSALLKLGAQKVVYGDETTWESLEAEQQRFFQKRFTQDGKTDWSIEKEWRLMGDLDLSEIENEDAFVFTSTKGEADLITQFSRWPVISIDQLTAEDTQG